MITRRNTRVVGRFGQTLGRTDLPDSAIRLGLGAVGVGRRTATALELLALPAATALRREVQQVLHRQELERKRRRRRLLGVAFAVAAIASFGGGVRWWLGGCGHEHDAAEAHGQPEQAPVAEQEPAAEPEPVTEPVPAA